MIEAVSRSELKGINKATEQIHAAVQFLAACGEYLIEKEEDGSHANLGWLSMKEKFISHPFGSKGQFVMELCPESMELTLANIKEKSWSSFKLKGEKQDNALSWIKSELQRKKIKGAGNYNLSFPYKLPDYAVLKGKKFKKSPKKAFTAFAKLRTWAEYFVNKHKLGFEFAEDCRTWPHHFDHASYIPLKKSKSGETLKSLSLGMAIHDGMIDEPYFYISAWKKDKVLDITEMKELSAGYWLNDSFKGAVLPVFDLADDSNFEARIEIYFMEAKDQLLKLLKHKD